MGNAPRQQRRGSRRRREGGRDEASEHARVHGSPGEGARLVGIFQAIWPLFLICAACGYLLGIALPAPNVSTTQLAVLFFILAGVLAAVTTKGAERLGAFHKGARGEEWVAHELAFLPAEYHVFHSIGMTKGPILPAGGSDYDHVVVGPAGVFTIETKNWAGAVRVQDGVIVCEEFEPNRPPLEQASAAAQDLRRRLRETLGADAELSVHPILCFVGGRVEGGTQGVGGVIVCSGRELNRVILESVERPLDAATRDRIVAYLARIAGH